MGLPRNIRWREISRERFEICANDWQSRRGEKNCTFDLQMKSDFALKLTEKLHFDRLIRVERRENSTENENVQLTKKALYTRSDQESFHSQSFLLYIKVFWWYNVWLIAYNTSFIFKRVLCHQRWEKREKEKCWWEDCTIAHYNRKDQTSREEKREEMRTFYLALPEIVFLYVIYSFLSLSLVGSVIFEFSSFRNDFRRKWNREEREGGRRREIKLSHTKARRDKIDLT